MIGCQSLSAADCPFNNTNSSNDSVLNCNYTDPEFTKAVLLQLSPIRFKFKQKESISCNLVISLIETKIQLNKVIDHNHKNYSVYYNNGNINSKGNYDINENAYSNKTDKSEHNIDNFGYDNNNNYNRHDNNNNNNNNNNDYDNKNNNNNNNNHNNNRKINDTKKNHRNLIADITATDLSFSLSITLPVKLPTIALIDKDAAEAFVMNLAPKLYLEVPHDWDRNTPPELKVNL